MELVDGIEPPTYALQVRCSTDWATPALHPFSRGRYTKWTIFQMQYFYKKILLFVRHLALVHLNHLQETQNSMFHLT